MCVVGQDGWTLWGGGWMNVCCVFALVLRLGFRIQKLRTVFESKKGGEKKRTGLDSNMHNKHTTEVYNGEPKRSRETSKKKEKRVP